jgi:hypothetical protein
MDSAVCQLQRKENAIGYTNTVVSLESIEPAYEAREPQNERLIALENGSASDEARQREKTVWCCLDRLLSLEHRLHFE